MLALNIFFLIEFLAMAFFSLFFLVSQDREGEEFFTVETILFITLLILSFMLSVKQLISIYYIMKGLK